jgi:cell division protein FtsA
MSRTANIVAGVEIGTSKICVVVGEQKPDGSLNIIGVGQSLSRGVRKGEIINPGEVEQDLREAVARAEQMADREIHRVFVGVSGRHIRGFNNRGFHRVTSPHYEISQADVTEVLNNAQAINLPAENSIIHTIRQDFMVGGEGGVTDPVGMHNAQLEVNLHVIHGKTTRLHDVIRLVESASLVVQGAVFNGLASALALLTHEQKDLGALVIDLGGGTSEYVVYSEGIIRHSGVLAIGGDHITNDLAYGLKISLAQAEKLKREHGSAIIHEPDKDRMIGVTDEQGREVKQVKAGHMQIIISSRLAELFHVIAEELAELDLTKRLRAGVFLCGGGSRLAEMTTLVQTAFQMEAALGHANAVSGQARSLDQPEFATAIGIVKYGALKQGTSGTKNAVILGIKDFFEKLRALVNWVRYDLAGS